MIRSLLSVAALMLCIGTLGATQIPTQGAAVDEFLAYQDTIRERFEQQLPRKLSRNEWSRLEQAQATLRKHLEGKPGMDALNDDERTAVFNAQEEVAALIRGDESERVICRRERPTGSNIGVRTCRTIAEINQARDAAIEAFMKLRTPVLDGG
ncbi:MAG TPA: hypothetical protein PKZ76_01930 [Xanthomonadaceae bacterium]|nr:hypothetical protein [Xanthomonadaceae bacterium]